MSDSRIIKNAGIVFLGDNALKILSMLLVFLIARSLGDSEYGKFSFIISFTGLFFMLLDLGTRILVIREVAEKKHEAPKIISNVICLKLLLSLVTYTIIGTTAFLLGYAKETLIGILIAALGIVFDSFAATLESLYQAFERMEYSSILKVGRVILRFGITLPFLSMGFMPVLIAYVAVQFLNLVVSLYFASRLIKPTFSADRKYMIDLVKRSFPFLLSGLFVSLYFRIDITLMSKLAPEALSGFYSHATRDAIIGWYSASYNILDGMISVAVAVSAALLPAAVNMAKSAPEKLEELYKTSVRYLSYISIPAATGIFLLADKIIFLVYQDKYAGSALALQILIWTIVPLYINYILGAMNIVLHQEKLGLIVLFLNCLVNIGLNLYLIPRYSLYGAAVATVLTEVFYFAGYYIILRRTFKNIDFLFLVKPVFSAAVMAFVILYVSLPLFFSIAIGGVTYITLMVLLRAISIEEIKKTLGALKR
ncbi:MAG: flippase [Nanoarchaeota archaeon]|nr:flippase [Nanoarchaeota archaeon]